MSAVAEVVNNRYVLLEKLGSGGMGAVFRASDRLTGQTVALKRVLNLVEQQASTPSSESTDLRTVLSNEFRTLASLRHPHIVSVIDYGFSGDRQPYFTMSLLENAKTLSEAAQNQPRTERIRMLVELLQALVYLHRRGVLHRDLKPGNILVDIQNTVKMLDFGLSLATSVTAASDMQTGMAGTLAYMAPELFMEEQPSALSDLYAFGVVAYELFTGQTPFYSKNIALMITSILNTAPNLSAVDESIQPVLERLLAKSPADRFANAEDTLRALCEAADFPLPRETIAIRESFLQTAPMVGRKEEFARLSDALKQTMNGHGSVWLIGGESGVGKSRLLDELRIRALVKGALVLRGHSVADGDTPYHAWGDVLQMLLMAAPPDDAEAAILKPVLPDIAALLDREVGDAPELPDAGQIQARLFSVIEAMLRRQNQPVLILLEDLQWAGSESLALVNYLATIVSGLPVTVIGDYRDDERPNLPQMLHDVPVIKLKRLSKDDIAEVSMSMLGEAGKRSEILNLLHQETEGNAFFLVEVVRALAEEAGELKDIGRTSLPQRVFAGGIRAIVERRLMRVSDDARGLLRMAAVVGRRLDLEIVAALTQDMNLDDWLTACANAAIVEVQDEKWHFAHSKLREALLESITDAERQPLYHLIAEAIEAARPNDPGYVTTLAHLWNVVGDDYKELEYVQAAGFAQFQANASVEAVPYLNRTIELIQKLFPEGAERIQRELEVQIPLSLALMQTRGFTTPDVEDAWARSRQLCDDLGRPPQLLGVLFGLCGVYTVSGRHEMGLDMDNEILALAPNTPHPNVTRMQAYFTSTSSYIALGRVKDALESATQVIKHYDPAEAQYAISTFGMNPGVTAKVWLSLSLQALGYPDQAVQKYEQAISEARALGHPFTLSTSLSFGWLHQLRRDPQTAFRFIEEGNSLARQYGFGFYQLIGMPVLGWSLAQQGKHMDGMTMLEQTLGIMRSVGIAYQRNYFLGLLADCYMSSGQFGDALKILHEAIDPGQQSSGRFFEPEIYRMLGQLALDQSGDVEQAEQHFLKAIDMAQEYETRSFELRATTSLARLWQKQHKEPEAHERLSRIYSWFTEGFDTPDLQDAKSMLVSLS